MINENSYREICSYCKDHNVTLVAVSKTKPVSDIQQLYGMGQRVFGENKVQEILEKCGQLPDDIEWHLIGHLQTNKVKQILPYVGLIHSVDSLHLMQEIEQQAQKLQKKIQVLLQLKIAQEDTKYGLDENELTEILKKVANDNYGHIEVRGLMGMASFTESETQVRAEFSTLKQKFDEIKRQGLVNLGRFDILSMGMSGDFQIAIEEGSNMIRVGSLIFGER